MIIHASHKHSGELVSFTFALLLYVLVPVYLYKKSGAINIHAHRGCRTFVASPGKHEGGKNPSRASSDDNR